MPSFNFSGQAVGVKDAQLPKLGQEVVLRTEVEGREVDLDVVQVARAALLELGHGFQRTEDNSLMNDAGWCITPRILSVEKRAKGVQAACTIEIERNRLITTKVFEFLYDFAADPGQALQSCFLNWGKIDLPVLLDSGRNKPLSCTCIEMPYPGNRLRRVLLGPVSHVTELPEPNDDPHPFCPCCMFTAMADSLKPLFAERDFLGIRLFAARAVGGDEVSADCRINGIDYPAGIEALKKYAGTWPSRGLEVRKQYVIIHDHKQPRSLMRSLARLSAYATQWIARRRASRGEG